MGDITKTRRTNWKCTWNATDLGYVDEVTPELSYMLEAITVGSIGKAKLGERFLGLSGDTIKIQVRECTRAVVEKLLPWFTGTTGSAEIALTPPINTDIYTYAQALVLHPEDLAAGTVNEDVELYKAVPVSAWPMKRNGQQDDVWEVTFRIFPDRTQLPALKYGRVKPTGT